MPESNLNLKFADFRSEVGFNLGWGRGPWNTRHDGELTLITNSGLRQAYYPPPLTPGGESYKWTFLRPTRQFTLTSGARTLLLPGEVGGIEGSRLAMTNSAGDNFGPVDVVGDGMIDREFGRMPDCTGRPQLVSMRWKNKRSGATSSQRSELYVFPEPDADYLLSVPYYIRPDALTTSHPYALAGVEHAEMFLESCLAIAEVRIDDLRPGEGPHWTLFMTRLATSISLDQRRKPRSLGYNGDRSDELHGYRNTERRNDAAVVTFGGITPN